MVVGCTENRESDLEIYDRLTVYSENEMIEMIEIINSQKSGSAKSQLYCTGEAKYADPFDPGSPGAPCSDTDCESEWVNSVPKPKVTKFCDGNVCPLNETDWYPVKCSNLLYNRCQVQVTNISACMWFNEAISNETEYSKSYVKLESEITNVLESKNLLTENNPLFIKNPIRIHKDCEQVIVKIGVDQPEFL